MGQFRGYVEAIKLPTLADHLVVHGQGKTAL